MLSGTPAESGNFNPVFTYTDSASHTLRVDNCLFINGAGWHPRSRSTRTAISARVTTGSFYSNQFSACCAGSIVWSVIGGAACRPASRSRSGGLLSGTPSTSGTYTFLLKAAETWNAGKYAARQFTLNVTPAPAPTITLSATTGRRARP